MNNDTLQSHTDSNVADTQALAVLSASLPPVEEKGELAEIKAAIFRSGMGIMRTSQGPSGTMIGYTAENEAKHSEKTLEVIHENIDLKVQLATLREELKATRKHLADANRGAETNAIVNQSLAGKVNNLREERDAMMTAIQAAREALPDIIAIALVKWGNLDTDATAIINKATQALKLLTPTTNP